MSTPFSPTDHHALLRRLEALADPDYKAFNEKTLPGVKTSYGIRLPVLRSLAKELLKGDPLGYLGYAVPDSYEEILIRGLVIAGLKLPWEEKRSLVEGFLPLIDNWAVCDTFCNTLKPRFPEDSQKLWEFLLPYYTDEREFFVRFAVVMQLSHFIKAEYLAEGLKMLENVSHPGYYAKMGVAWALSMWYVSFPQEVEELLKRQSLSPWVQNKTIQKIRESRQVSQEAKNALLAYKR